MKIQKRILIHFRHLPFLLFITFLLLVSCSKTSSPLIPPGSTESDNAPLLELSTSGEISSGTGLLAAYELTIDPDNQFAELIPKRSSNIGESFTVNGLIFFTKTPCYGCFRLKSTKWDYDSLILQFALQHPLPKGNTSNPPSASNRLDLDIFDVAALVKTTGPNFNPVTFDLNFKKAYNAISNPDFYTGELENILGVTGDILPAVLVIDNADMGLNTKNKFEMGSTHDFDVIFKNTGEILYVDIYLTFGYGVSATWQNRFEPKYYNPEFNRKAAWKIEAEPLGFWLNNDNQTTVDVEVKVWDWQMWGTQVSTEDDFADADPSHVFAASRVDSVSVEIEGMNNTPTTVDGDSFIGGSGTPLSPLIYRVPVKNEKNLPLGEYRGLVKVTDERPTLLPTDNRDILIDSTDGINLDKYGIPEYASYQLFTASVETGCNKYCWAETWGWASTDNALSVFVDDFGYVYCTGKMDHNGTKGAFIYVYDTNGNNRMENWWYCDDGVYPQNITVDDAGNIYICGVFEGVSKVGSSWDGIFTSNGSNDSFVSAYNPFGYWQWTKTWGNSDPDTCYSLDINHDGEIYVSGGFKGTVEFNPDGGESHSSKGDKDLYLTKFDSDGNWLITQTWGGVQSDCAGGLSIDLSDNIYTVGFFSSNVEFNPDGGGLRASNGGTDAFLSKFSSSDTWQWAKSWGGPTSDYCKSIAAGSDSDVYVCGKFSGTVDFDPDGGGSKTAIDFQDIFLTKFLSDGTWDWASTFGGNNEENVNDMGINAAGDIFLTGNFVTSCNFNPLGTSIQTSNSGSYDSYITKFNTDGDWILAKVWGGSGEDAGRSIEVDYFGCTYIGGQFTGTTNLDPDGIENHDSAGGYDCFISKLCY